MTTDGQAPTDQPQGAMPPEGSQPPLAPEEAPAERAEASGKPTDSEAASPPVDLGPKTGGAETGPPTAETPAAKPAAERPARPAREVEPKEAPRVAPQPGSINETLAAAVPGIAMKAYMVPSLTGESVAVEVGRDDLTAVMTAARDDPRLDLKYLRCLSGVDWQEEGLEVVYHLWSFTKMHHLTVKTRLPRDDATLASVSALYPAADWHERETRDMFGIDFAGHPNLVPLLLPEDMTDHHPLLKDNPLQEIEEWQGENLRGDEGGDGEVEE
jgi:NADH-quinone oxidoreductase subunit C